MTPEREDHPVECFVCQAARDRVAAWHRRVQMETADAPVPLRLVGGFSIAWPGRGIVDASEWFARLSPVTTYTLFVWTGRN